MYPKPTFHTATDDFNLGFAKSRGFAVLMADGHDGKEH